MITKNKLLVFSLFLIIFIPFIFAYNAADIESLITSVKGDVNLLAEHNLPFQKSNDTLKYASSLFSEGKYNESFQILSDVKLEIQDINFVGTRLVQLEEIISNSENSNTSINISKSQLLVLKQEFITGNLLFVKQEIESFEEDIFYSLFSNFDPLKNSFINLSQNLELNNTDWYSSYIKRFQTVNKQKDFVKLSYLKNEVTDIVEKLNKTNNLKIQILILKQENVSSERLNQLFNAAKSSLIEEDFDAFNEQIDSANKILQSANKAIKSIHDAESYINELQNQSIIVDDVALLEEAKIELNYENYEGAYSLAEEYLNYLSELENSQILLGILNKKYATASIKNFFLKFWWLIILLGLFGYLINIIFHYYLTKFLLSKNQNNQVVINELRKTMQKRYYVSKIIDKESFDSQNNYYDNKEFKLKQKNEILSKRLFSLEQNKIIRWISRSVLFKKILLFINRIRKK